MCTFRMAKKVSIVIVSYNVRQLLVQCIDSVRKALAGLDGEIVVVDNCSKDDTQVYLETNYPDVRLLANQENVGFARAMHAVECVARVKPKRRGIF
ncbi:MAG: glycosyltransferase family 2 protein [Prevotella sp.]|nr:glycosyltransferase family 2 protein [Prevotella sp.]